jgi:hypothetical protein
VGPIRYIATLLGAGDQDVLRSGANFRSVTSL